MMNAKCQGRPFTIVWWLNGDDFILYVDVNVNVNCWMVVKCHEKEFKPKIVIVTSYQHLLSVSLEVQKRAWSTVDIQMKYLMNPDWGKQKRRWWKTLSVNRDHLSITLGAPWLRGLKAVAGVTTKKKWF